MEDEKLSSFTFFRSYYEAAKDLPDGQKLALYEAIIKYGIEGEESEMEGIVKTMFILIEPNLSRSRAKVQAGSKGGRSKAEANAKQTPSKHQATPSLLHKQTPSKLEVATVANAKQTQSCYGSKRLAIGEGEGEGEGYGYGAGKGDNIDALSATKKSKKTKINTPVKLQFAEFVSMTNDEHSSLVAKIGEQATARCIEILDNYKGANGKRYNSDYRAILNWVIERVKNDSPGLIKRPPAAEGNPFAQYKRGKET